MATPPAAPPPRPARPVAAPAPAAAPERPVRPSGLVAARNWVPSPAESRVRSTLRVVRSSAGLVIIALALGLALAAALGALVWALAAALHHASTA